MGTTTKYGVFAANDNVAYVCTLRAARSMAYQGIITPRGHIEQLAEMEGHKIIGTKIRSTFAIHPEVYVLIDLRKKPEFYRIDPLWSAIDPVPVISTPTYGEMTAPAVVKQLNI